MSLHHVKSTRFMMRSLSGIRCVVSSLFLLWMMVAAEEPCCSVTGPVEELHPVQGLLERFEVGPGCAARQRGNKETHVVAVGTVTNAENKVTVLLKPLSPPPSALRPLHLLLSSKLPVRWWLEAERLPSSLPVLVQVSSNSSVQSHSLHLLVQPERFLPFRPRALHRWALKQYDNLSSMTHSTRGNRVYIWLGEDPTQPAVCQLQAMFLSHNYMTSDLQPQDVQGCVCTPVGRSSPEVHVIKLHSAGSGLCGSVQVEVTVSLLPPGGNSNPLEVVLVLSSSVPVNWAIDAHGVRGHVSVHSSNTVSPPFPPEPNLTLSSTLLSDLSTVSDVLAWARDSGFPQASSYTEADLANRFVIQLAGGGTDVFAALNPQLARPPWTEERRLRQWLEGGGRGALTVQCEDGRLSAAVGRHALQASSDPVAAVTLRDPTCQARFNGSHFLLVFPVISCGTEALLLSQPKGVRYKNMVLFWRNGPRTLLSLNETESKSEPPLRIHFDCLASVPASPRPATDNVTEPQSPQTELEPWEPRGHGPEPKLSRLATLRHKPGPVLVLRLFVTERYEQSRVGPCVVPANQRIYTEISAEGPLTDVVEVKSCVVSPLSDPKKLPVWFVIREGCSSDTSLILQAEEETEGDGRRRGPETMRPLRFSFILRPRYNDSMHFLHCSLRLCASDSSGPDSASGCEAGLRIPALVSKSSQTSSVTRSLPPVFPPQCEIRTLSRPVVVTQSLTSPAPKPQRPPAGQRTRSLSVAPLAVPQPEDRGPELPTGAVMGVVLLSFVMGVGLMGGLWCIYSSTGGRHPSLRGDEGYLTDQNPGEQHMWKPPAASDQSCSSV